MSTHRAWILGLWLSCTGLAAWGALHARYVADLSAFLPARPTSAQRLLVDQLRTGPGSRLIMIALRGGPVQTRAGISLQLARSLAADDRFSSVASGAALTAQRDREVLFAHRYVLSEAVSPQHFSAEGLRSSLKETLADLASPVGLAIEPLAERDPTGEMLAVIGQLSRPDALRGGTGSWVSADGARTVLIAETAASGSDTDAQAGALRAVRAAFARAASASRDPAARDVQLVMSGPGVFAVEARAGIERAVLRLSLAGSALIAITLLAVYRSPLALALGLLPVATGALAGVAAVAWGFGVVHGITLGFGITLIGEAVDYSIYYFIQSADGAAIERGTAPGGGIAMGGGPVQEGGAAAHWQRRLWPTLRLGMLTSVAGFVSLLPSGFPGLAQLGAYSASGLLAAAFVTRFVLPVLVPRRFRIRDLAPAGERAARALRALDSTAPWIIAGGAGAASILILCVAPHAIWSRELSSLSPIPSPELELDAQLRRDLGVADSLDLVVVPARSLDAALGGAELAVRALEPLVENEAIGSIDNPAAFLPSRAVQEARRASLPDRETLDRNLDQALAGLPLDGGRLTGFKEDLEAARHAPPMGVADLAGTSMGAGLDALVMHRGDDWSALLPLRPAGKPHSSIDLQAVRRALAIAHTNAQVLDLKQESDALYAHYLHEVMRLCAGGLAAIALLLALALRSWLRAARVLAPLALAVLVVIAALVLSGVELTLMHLVGMLLIVAIGSNYALFFDSRGRGSGGSGDSPVMLVSLGVANACTVVAFGLLCCSRVPVLDALGATVAPGALLALIFAALLTPARTGAHGAHGAHGVHG